MPIKKAAFEELHKAKKRQIRNTKITSELKTLDKQFNDLLNKKNLEQAKKILIRLSSKLDKAAAKRIIPKNRASRKKSRLMRQLKKVQ